MVPAAFVVLEQLPKLTSGKVDRRALPAPADEDAATEHGYVAPATETEEVVAELFSALLGRERVGIYDNFFALGGHSLLATQLVTRARNAFEVELSVRDLFAAPTVGRLAVLVEERIIRQLEELSDEEVERLEREG
jgi:acyl carrier protein